MQCTVVWYWLLLRTYCFGSTEHIVTEYFAHCVQHCCYFSGSGSEDYVPILNPAYKALIGLVVFLNRETATD